MASEAVKRQRAVRRRTFARTMVACSALFLMLFALMAGQMALGHDPAVGAARQPATTTQVAQASPPRDLKTAAGQAVGAVIGSVISDTIEGDDGEAERQAPVQSAPAQGQQSPAPVQSGTS